MAMYDISELLLTHKQLETHVWILSPVLMMPWC